MMTKNGKIKVGDPVMLLDAGGLGVESLKSGDKGWANSITAVPGDKTYVFYMPEDSKTTYVLDIDRLKFDEDRAQLELDKDTIHKD